MELSRPAAPSVAILRAAAGGRIRAKSIAAMSADVWRVAVLEDFRQWLLTGRRVTFAAKRLLCARLRFALVAQLDRASDFEAAVRFATTH